jgi:prepilin peptidase CpaA
MHVGPLPPTPIPLCVILWVLVAASTDLAARRIPNWLVVSGLLAALAVRIWLQGAVGSLDWLEGMLTGFGILLPFYILRGMAAGDVKLMSMVGAWVGPVLGFDIALTTFVIGALWSIALVLLWGRLHQLVVNLILIATARRTPDSPSDASSTAPAGLVQSVGSIPYGVAIAIGTIGMLSVATR